MKFSTPLTEATLLKRYKRFLADVSLKNGKKLTIYCPNTGSMKNCDILGSRIWFSTSSSTTRKYPNTWEIVEVDGGALVGINTAHPNTLVAEAITNGVITELQGYDEMRGEVRYGEENSRIDLLLTRGDEKCYVEVKNVTLGDDDGIGFFPDAVTKRGAKHMRELMAMKQQGHRAVVLFCVQHTGIVEVHPAKNIDPIYAETLGEAINAGVEVIAYQADVSPDKIELLRRIPFVLHT